MSKTSLTVPAAEANRSFSKLLRAAREGARITITSHGEPIAELGPVGSGPAEAAELERRNAAHDALVKRLKSQTPMVVGPWTRQDLYERD
jgi:prevent-host-death family protein